MKNKRIYLDYASTTPVDPRVLEAVLPYFSEKFGNTMSIHSFGQEAIGAVAESRKIIADFIGSKPSEVCFTGSATESNNLALKGVMLKDFGQKKRKGHLIISKIEHPCIMESAEWLERQGFSVTRAGVDRYGILSPETIRKAITKDTVLVSIIHASNEIGTVQDISAIGKICREKGVYLHSDCAQSFGKIPVDVNKMNLDLMTASSHKIYGPKGAACLFVRDGVKIEPILHGGGQESGLRSSTVNVPAIVGFAKAVQICKKEMQKDAKKAEAIRKKIITEVLKIKGSHLNGHLKNRLPNIVNFWFEFVEGEAVVLQLDLEGVAASTGSACSSLKLEPSRILMATGLKERDAHGSLRVSFGRWTKESEINHFIKVMPSVVERLRKISGHL